MKFAPFQAGGVVLFIGWRVGAERRGESGSSSGWRRRYCFRSTAAIAELGGGLRNSRSQQHGDGEILRSQYEAIFLILGNSQTSSALIGPFEIPGDR